MRNEKLNRRQFLALGIAGTHPALRIPRSAFAGPQPNVLVFMSDQESALLPGPAFLPNRRKLEADGMRFTRAFCNTPQCSAARSVLLTGLEPHETGVLTNVDTGSLGKPLRSSLPNIGSVFQKAGYTTGYFGKWHLGNDQDGLAQFGFETYRRGGDEEVARQAADWIRKQRGPWLAWVSVINPHDIYSLPRKIAEVKPRPGVKPPSSDLRNLAGKPSEQQQYVDKDQGRATRTFTADDWVKYRSFYLELVEKADSHLGTVVEAVRNLDFTIVAYTSDHGDALGEHGLPFKGPFMYEEGIRIPLVVSIAGAFSRAMTRDNLVTQADLAPMLAEAAGVEWPHAVPESRDAVFLEYYAKQKWVNPIRTIRTERWKLNRYDRGNRELYDLETDPHELTNLAGRSEHARTQAQLEKRIEAWRKPMLPARG